MALLQRLRPISYEQLLEVSGMTDAPKKEVRETFKMTSKQLCNYSTTGAYRENIPMEVVLLGVLTGKIDHKKLVKLMLE